VILTVVLSRSCQPTGGGGAGLTVSVLVASSDHPTGGGAIVLTVSVFEARRVQPTTGGRVVLTVSVLESRSTHRARAIFTGPYSSSGLVDHPASVQYHAQIQRSTLLLGMVKDKPNTRCIPGSI
jgi:hypothetical protein